MGLPCITLNPFQNLSVATVQAARSSRRLAASRSRKTEHADAKVLIDPYTQVSPTIYGKISRAAFHVAQQSINRSPGSREQGLDADELWESPGHIARRGSASSSLNSTAHKVEQVVLQLTRIPAANRSCPAACIHSLPVFAGRLHRPVRWGRSR